jgi:hypothetical protein
MSGSGDDNITNKENVYSSQNNNRCWKIPSSQAGTLNDHILMTTSTVVQELERDTLAQDSQDEQKTMTTYMAKGQGSNRNLR